MKKSRWTAYDITLGALFVALMAIGANITAIVPFLTILGVPLTLQTFFAILAGLVLGSRLGFFSMVVYAALGLVGAPVFAGFEGGLGVVLSPTFGFVLSFILMAYFVGKISEKRRNVPLYIAAALVGLIINYAVGVNWFYGAMNFWVGEGIPYAVAWSSMVPFLLKDLALSIVAGVFAYRLERTYLYRTPLRQQANAS